MKDNTVINEKRENKGYKVANSFYFKAMERATKEKTPLAGMIEQLVINYSNGMLVSYTDPAPIVEIPVVVPVKKSNAKPKSAKVKLKK